MANRLTRRRQAITAAGCVFCCAALLLISGAQGAMVSCQVMGTGDQLSSSSTWNWAASTGNLQAIPPLTCGNELLTGSYSSHLLSRGGSYQASRGIDNSEIMVFSEQSQLTAGSGYLRESLYLFEAGSTLDNGPCTDIAEEAAANFSAYNQMAGVSAVAMGDVLNYQSRGAVTQADDTIPDSLAMQVLASGDGMAQITAGSFNQVGIGNTSALGYEQRMRDQIRAGGDQFEAGMIFQWTSFANMWPEEEEE